MEVDFDRHADELLAALGPDGLRAEIELLGEDRVLVSDGNAPTIRDVAEFGVTERGRLLDGEQLRVDRYRALRRKVDALERP